MSQKIKERIKQLAAELLPEAVQWRRHFHMHPELAFEEFKTAAFIASRLDEMNIPYRTGVAQTGIVALLEGKNPAGKVVGLRADMDALPIEEKNVVEYRSRNAGLMHACGHDMHMACLLGAAKILSEIRAEIQGSVKLIFQPSEEKLPGGASVMIQEGVLENPRVDKMFAQHVLPTLPVGKVGMKGGLYMASADEIYITVKGKGGHAAMPDLLVDPVLIAAHLIVALQQIISRKANPAIPGVLSFGRIIADGRTNIIPDSVAVEGTFRTLDETWRAEAHEQIRHLAAKLANSMGGSCEVNIVKGYPCLHNDQALAAYVWKDALEYMGEENVAELDIRMTAEDFAYFSQQIPSCFYRLGTAAAGMDMIENLHSSTYNPDENSMETGMGFMAWLAFSELERP